MFTENNECWGIEKKSRWSPRAVTEFRTRGHAHQRSDHLLFNSVWFNLVKSGTLWTSTEALCVGSVRAENVMLKAENLINKWTSAFFLLDRVIITCSNLSLEEIQGVERWLKGSHLFKFFSTLCQLFWPLLAKYQKSNMRNLLWFIDSWLIYIVTAMRGL